MRFYADHCDDVFSLLPGADKSAWLGIDFLPEVPGGDLTNENKNIDK